mmetsp:Transcript_23084/g.72380  ORF Transcript_23084/g.72380 Transcript_23084/m.72380 type:complete len:297 (-) Transcript_23084:1132-2022(-)
MLERVPRGQHLILRVLPLEQLRLKRRLTGCQLGPGPAGLGLGRVLLRAGLVQPGLELGRLGLLGVDQALPVHLQLDQRLCRPQLLALLLQLLPVQVPHLLPQRPDLRVEMVLFLPGCHALLLEPSLQQLNSQLLANPLRLRQTVVPGLRGGGRGRSAVGCGPCPAVRRGRWQRRGRRSAGHRLGSVLGGPLPGSLAPAACRLPLRLLSAPLRWRLLRSYTFGRRGAPSLITHTLRPQHRFGAQCVGRWVYGLGWRRHAPQLHGLHVFPQRQELRAAEREQAARALAVDERVLQHAP